MAGRWRSSKKLTTYGGKVATKRPFEEIVRDQSDADALDLKELRARAVHQARRVRALLGYYETCAAGTAGDLTDQAIGELDSYEFEKTFGFKFPDDGNFRGAFLALVRGEPSTPSEAKTAKVETPESDSKATDESDSKTPKSDDRSDADALDLKRALPTDVVTEGTINTVFVAIRGIAGVFPVRL